MALQFSRIRATNWRNFKSFDVELQNRAFLVGANASGKSNFLDLLRFLRDLAAASGGGFQQAVRSRGGVSAVRNVSARHPSTDVEIDVTVSDDGNDTWRYLLAFNQERSTPVLRHEAVWYQEKQLIQRPDRADHDDPARMHQTHLEQTFANADFRDLVNFFQSIQYSHLVPQLVRDSERYGSTINDPFGGDFLEQVANVNKRTRDARLRRIQKALQSAIPDLRELEWLRDNKGIPHLRGRYKNWRKNDVWHQETEFSDGTLRLIGLLWALQDGDGPLLLEEPELSLHPGIVQHFPKMMNNVQRSRKKAVRQIIASTHSSDLLHDDGIGADEMLLFQVDQEGTRITVGADDEAIMQELGAGLSMADVILPRTEPISANQLMLPLD